MGTKKDEILDRIAKDTIVSSGVELEAMRRLIEILEPLDNQARERVLVYVYSLFIDPEIRR